METLKPADFICLKIRGCTKDLQTRFYEFCRLHAGGKSVAGLHVLLDSYDMLQIILKREENSQDKIKTFGGGEV